MRIQLSIQLHSRFPQPFGTAPLFWCASFLDPRTKKLSFLQDNDRDLVFESIQRKVLARSSPTKDESPVQIVPKKDVFQVVMESLDPSWEKKKCSR